METGGELLEKEGGFLSGAQKHLFPHTASHTATKKNGLEGWNSTAWTSPLDFLKGACDLRLLSWWMSTDRGELRTTDAR